MKEFDTLGKCKMCNMVPDVVRDTNLWDFKCFCGVNNEIIVTGASSEKEAIRRYLSFIKEQKFTTKQKREIKKVAEENWIKYFENRASNCEINPIFDLEV